MLFGAETGVIVISGFLIFFCFSFLFLFLFFFFRGEGIRMVGIEGFAGDIRGGRGRGDEEIRRGLGR